MSRRSPPAPHRAPRAVLAAAATFVLATALAPAARGGLGAAARALLGGAPAGARRAVVAEVLDGDTVVLEDRTVVRLLGIDAPETHHPDMAGPQAFGQAAADRLAALVAGRAVRLEADAAGADRYGRTLRHLWIGRRLAAELLVSEGLAYVLVIPPNTRHAARLRAAEAAARSGGRGLWGAARPTALPVFGTPAP